MRFRLAPISVTLDALERPKRPLLKIKSTYGEHQKKIQRRYTDIISGKI